MLPTSFLSSSDQRQKRSFTREVMPFLNNIIFQYTISLFFQTEALLIRDNGDSYLYYFRH